MARITVEDCLTKENNRFALVQLASKRTKQLLQGSQVRTQDRKNKAVVTALREIAEGQVRFMTPEESVAFEEEKVREAEAARAAAAVERERRPEIGAGLFSNGNDTRSVDFLRESLSSTGTTPGASDDEE
jgi:DNA-directed RNA polymerase subunit omega